MCCCLCLTQNATHFMINRIRLWYIKYAYCFSWLLADMRLTLRWRHNDHAGVSNHQPHGCLLNRLFRLKSKITSKLRVTGLCAGNSPGTGEFPAQMASYAENVSIWWRHDEYILHDRFPGHEITNAPVPVNQSWWIWLSPLPLDKMAAISQTTFSNTFLWMKILYLDSNFHWSLFLRVQLTIFQHWFR